MELNLPSPLEQIELSFPGFAKRKVYLKRDDLIHSEWSGNKWRKLKLNVANFKAGKYDAILSFGGAYSNHISALAAVGRQAGIPTIGIIRGDELTAESNETLRAANAAGMQLCFVTREEYSWRYEKDYKQILRDRYGNVLVVEEGGANFHGVMGCTEIVTEVEAEIQPDTYILASGTGTTAAGILFATAANVISVPVFKNGAFIRDEIRDLLYYSGASDSEIEEMLTRLYLATDYHFGGYGKSNDHLLQLMNTFYQETEVPTDHIYTGKMIAALIGLTAKESDWLGQEIVAIHTGGIQGNSTVQDKLKF